MRTVSVFLLVLFVLIPFGLSITSDAAQAGYHSTLYADTIRSASSASAVIVSSAFVTQNVATFFGTVDFSNTVDFAGETTFNAPSTFNQDLRVAGPAEFQSGISSQADIYVDATSASGIIFQAQDGICHRLTIETGGTLNTEIAPCSDNSAPTAPGAPLLSIQSLLRGELASTSSDFANVELRWTPPQDTGGVAISGYQVLRSGSVLVTLGPDVREYTVSQSDVPTPLDEGDTFSYSVRALNAVGAGSADIDTFTVTHGVYQANSAEGNFYCGTETGPTIGQCQHPRIEPTSFAGAISTDSQSVNQFCKELGYLRAQYHQSPVNIQVIEEYYSSEIYSYSGSWSQTDTRGDVAAVIECTDDPVTCDEGYVPNAQGTACVSDSSNNPSQECLDGQRYDIDSGMCVNDGPIFQ